jgi:Dolichyl-phosphate-mannose-protein mannosyltransferase
MRLVHRDSFMAPPVSNRWLARLALLAVFFALAVGLQYLGHAYRAELSGYPDEPAHFVSGIMVKDYLFAFPASPITFAKDYYIHRPKVAVGHWPPLFYLIQGAWFLVFGGSRSSVLLLMAVITAAIANTVTYITRLTYGSWAGFAAGLIFLILPIVQLQAQEVMSDMLVALFGLWATLAFAGFISSGCTSDLFRFTIFAVLAISTKSSGLYLALCPPLALLLTGHLRCLRDPRLWASAALVGLPSGAWVWFSAKFVLDTWVEKPSLGFVSRALVGNAAFLLSGFGMAFSILIGMGLYSRLARPLLNRMVDPRWGSLAATALSVFLFQSLVSAGLEPRFLVPAIPALIPFLIAGAAWLSGAVGTGWWSQTLRFATILALCGIAFAAQTFAIPRKPYRGFSEVAKFLISIPEAHHAAILVSSESDGEGLLISELLMREPWNDGFVLRASKLLSKSDWLGRNYSPRFSSKEDLQDYLNRLPVDFVVIDQDTGPATLAHQRLLIDAVRDSSNWRRLDCFPHNSAASLTQGILVYRRIGVSRRPDEQVRSEMQQILGSKLN